MMIFPGYNKQTLVLTSKKLYVNEKSLHFLSKKAKKVPSQIEA